MKQFVGCILIFSLFGTVQASTLSLGAPLPGEPGSMENPLATSDTLFVPILTDESIISLEVVVEILNGPGSIVDYMDFDDLAAYGWDPALSFAPLVDLPESVEFGAGRFDGNSGPEVGFIEIHCDGAGSVTVRMTEGFSFRGPSIPPFPSILDEITIYQVPEPGTLVLLVSGGLLIRKKTPVKK